MQRRISRYGVDKHVQPTYKLSEALWRPGEKGGRQSREGDMQGRKFPSPLFSSTPVPPGELARRLEYVGQVCFIHCTSLFYRLLS